MNNDLPMAVSAVLPVLLVGAILLVPDTRSKLVDFKIKNRATAILLAVVGISSLIAMGQSLLALAGLNKLGAGESLFLVGTVMFAFTADALLAVLAAGTKLYNQEVDELQARRSEVAVENAHLRQAVHLQEIHSTLMSMRIESAERRQLLDKPITGSLRRAIAWMRRGRR